MDRGSLAKLDARQTVKKPPSMMAGNQPHPAQQHQPKVPKIIFDASYNFINHINYAIPPARWANALLGGGTAKQYPFAGGS